MAIPIGAGNRSPVIVAPAGKWNAKTQASVNKQAAAGQAKIAQQMAAAKKAAALRAAIASSYQNTIEGLPVTSTLNAEQIAGGVAQPYNQTYNAPAPAKPVYRPPAPVYQSTGAGRTRQVGTSADSEGAGASPAPVAAMTQAATQVQAPPAQIEAPAVIADAGAGSQNVAGESFTSLGNNMTAGEYLRQRGSRGPKTGLSFTPEMIRRAAGSRLS